MKTKVHTIYKNNKGVRLPGVTTILRILGKPALIHWAWKLGTEGQDYRKVRDKAANIGTIAHYLIECDLKGIKPELDDYPKSNIEKAENAYLAFLDWRKSHNLKTLHSELQLISEKHGYGGTLDWIASNNDELWLIDLKSSKAIYPEMQYQLAAYLNLWNENHSDTIKKVRIIKLSPQDGSFQDHVISDKELDKGFKIFSHCLEIYRLTRGGK